jgi:hypothetical protein
MSRMITSGASKPNGAGSPRRSAASARSTSGNAALADCGGGGPPPPATGGYGSWLDGAAADATLRDAPDVFPRSVDWDARGAWYDVTNASAGGYAAFGARGNTAYRLQRASYYDDSPMDELRRWTEAELARVRDFAVVRRPSPAQERAGGAGAHSLRVCWPGETDLRALDLSAVLRIEGGMHGYEPPVDAPRSALPLPRRGAT